MRIPTVIILIGLLTKPSLGQKTINIQIRASGDTTLWYGWQHELDSLLKLPYLINNTDSFYFRFWTDKQAIDIWSQDNKIFNGLLTSFTHTYERYNEKKQKRNSAITYSSKIQIDTALARQVYESITAISLIPDDDSIKEWQLVEDGITYKFEMSSPTHYSFKTYGNPDSQPDSLNEAKQIQTFVDKMDSIVSLKAEYAKFFATLKPGSYTTGGVITTKLTPKQIEYYKRMKPYEDYMASIKDTLNAYLSDTLTKLFSHYGELQCYGQFFLRFSKENVLEKVITNSKLEDREDRVNFRNCRNKIQEAFKHVTIDFVHSKVGYWKELSYWEKEVRIYQ